MQKATITTEAQLNELFFSTLIEGELDQLVVLFNKCVDQNPNGIEIINRFFCSSFHLQLLYTKIQNNEVYLHRLLANSYKHGNGFNKIVLLSGVNFKIRLHEFGKSEEVPMENVHDHRWAFSSYIFHGTLQMEIYNVYTSEGEEVLHYKYNSNKAGGSYGAKYIGPAFVKHDCTLEFSAGKAYKMIPSEFHRITNKRNQECITLICTGKPISEECNLFSRSEMQHEEKQLQKFSQEELESIFNTIFLKISNSN